MYYVPRLPRSKSLVIGGRFEDGSVCLEKKNSQNIREVVTLRCNHVEADTRMFLHGFHASNVQSVKRVIFIHSPDTDVFILVIRFWEDFKPVGATALGFVTGVLS